MDASVIFTKKKLKLSWAPAGERIKNDKAKTSNQLLAFQ
ncbi:hypothetical protein SPAR155_1213 [Streptococcus pneumoniae GA04672]|nr:hypothetical protein SP305906_1262 [Streptococcus pneumoniae CDC3059-06]EHD42238.1 hypothetical protein SPAR77_1265 [Streptococcus pneumoniae GA43265]EHD50523.1 hypothetical protein SPAR122_1230 [Streptococcus pneumoniae 6901-05]EHD69765.1 hypothetical protein SPAR124_1224 [Streptococcus pneumoniae 6963-05]EHE45162.1 hypothetical protein SPAR109_1302 [Streptococcus pneumoniae GA47976]EHE77029.1 hypothetical protein SPAR23_1616 [Streptococcus pneumoniae GA11426]EHZ02952.1 hypothetical prote